MIRIKYNYARIYGAASTAHNVRQFMYLFQSERYPCTPKIPLQISKHICNRDGYTVLTELITNENDTTNNNIILCIPIMFFITNQRI